MNSYSEFTKTIKEAVRRKAVETPRFAEKKQGCIRITSYPQCQEAYAWMGGVGKFDPNDIPDVEDVYVILPGGTRIARFENSDGTEDVVDTYAITAMKIARLSYVNDLIISDVPIDDGLSTENGFAPWRGALCCAIVKKYDAERNRNFESDGDVPPFCLVYISVSGASQDEDLACAKNAIGAIKEFFSEEEELHVIAP